MVKLSARGIRGLWIVFLLSTLCYAFLVYYFFVQTRSFAFAEGEKQVENVLLTHKAVHAFVETNQKPEIYRLKKEGRLYADYFSPQLLSRTFIARGIHTLFNLEREENGLDPLYFKLATLSPRNSQNTADAAEKEILQRMQSEGLSRYSEVVEVDGHSLLYYAIPVDKTTTSCLRCHGDPQDAPHELLERYGDTNAFHEQEGQIRAMISLRVPLDAQLQAARSIFIRLTLGTGFLLLLVLAIVVFSAFRIETYQNVILAQNAELNRLATIDMLTGVYNRQGFIAAMTRELALGSRYRQELSVILLDIDFFKKINDTYGHGVGDSVLTTIGRLLREAGRAEDIAARWGGEEFIIACPHTPIDGAVELAQKLEKILASQEFPHDIRITASFGVAQGQPHQSLDQLIEQADRALYLAKEQGRNRICQADEKNGFCTAALSALAPTALS